MAFRDQFGEPAQHIGIAPGRVNLIGEHVDYEGGLVMPMAIDRHLVIALAPNDRRVVRLWSDFSDGLDEVDLDKPLEPIAGSWTNYVLGVVARLKRDGVDVPGFDAAVVSDVPVGAGLSSSAALEVASCVVVEALTGVELTGQKRARVARDAEHEFAGVPCGIMDQMAVTHGRANHAILLDCATLDIEHVPLPSSLEVLILNTCTKHALADGEYAQRREECAEARNVLGVGRLCDANLSLVEERKEALGDIGYRRARHVVSEIARVGNFKDALCSGDLEATGKLMAASHASLRDDFEVSCRELDVMQEIASRSSGVVGARMTGGGFGGCVVAICDGRSTEIASTILEEYECATQIAGENYWVSAADAAFGVTVACSV